MSYEEFREFYISSRQTRFNAINHTDTHSSRVGSSAPAHSPPNTTQASIGGADVPSHHQPQQQQFPMPLAQTGAGGGAQESVWRVFLVHWGRRGANFVWEWTRGHLRVLLNIFFATEIFFDAVTPLNFFFLLAVYIIFTTIQNKLARVAVRGDTNAEVTTPSIVCRFVIPSWPAGPVSTFRRIAYIIAKCIESFILSLSPTYSVQQLITELTTDGIVTR